MNIVQQQSLKKYNTFGIEAFAAEFCEVNSISDLARVLKENQEKKLFILGGGSNLLLTQKYYLCLYISNVEKMKKSFLFLCLFGSLSLTSCFLFKKKCNCPKVRTSVDSKNKVHV
jgi:hypothetical protein